MNKREGVTFFVRANVQSNTYQKMIPSEELQTFASDIRSQAYLLVVFLAISCSFHRYYKCTSPLAPTKGGRNSQSRPSFIPPLLSLCVLCITWFYIFRFIVTHIHTSKSYFGDAYRDVLKDEGQHMISVQLLTWAIVSVIWIEDEGTVSDLVFLGYGFLGAMGASFSLWVPSLYRRSDRSRLNNRRTVSLFCVLCAVIAFVCIVNIAPCSGEGEKEEECEKDNRFGSFRPSFENWLHGLHYILVVPALGKVIPSLASIRVDAAVVYFITGIILSYWHFSLLMSSNESPLSFVLSNPMTDCQISITTDMVCCSLITLYTIYRDNLLFVKAGWFGKKGTDSMARNVAYFRTSLAVIGLTLVSPAAVLAFHLCSRCAGASHMALVSKMQQRTAEKLQTEHSNRHGKTTGKLDQSKICSNLQGPTWCNLGLWNEAKHQLDDYNNACERLAFALANAADLSSEDKVLCCGCGSGPELELYKDQFQVKHITGIDPEIDRVAAWEKNRLLKGGDFNIRRIKAGVEDLYSSDGVQLFRPSVFTKILALDNVYHYASKYNFFRDCAALLPPGGKVAVTDILIHESTTPLWAKFLMIPFGIPFRNVWTKNDYIKHLSDLGFVDIDVQSTKGSVFRGWEQYLPHILLQHLDYSIIVGTVPIKCQQQGSTPKKVAIIGSGMAGLAAAHTLKTSSSGADIEITIFEANDRPGLAGNSTWYEDHLVDIPPRMASEGYYIEYRKMLKALNIPTQLVRTDCTYYKGDENGKENAVHAYYDKSYISNFFFTVFVGGLSNFWKLARAMSGINKDKDISTFGDWLRKHSLYSARTMDTLEMCQDNPFLYLIVGSLGWMLSCTYEQLLKYPADIILPYLHSLFVSSVKMRGDGQVVRVNPSIKMLEHNLLYGVEKLECGVRISDVDGTKTINGVKYDTIICSTEASAVPKVLRHAPKVFAQVEYHPSIIYLHTDESFMPPERKDWRRWNVEMKHGYDEAQLTFWLNEVYPDSRFSSNVFQTWAPMHSPKPDTIIKKACFQRVVHTTNTRHLVSQIESLQGKEGIYFAGSYTVYGMGLLEQALISGRSAANRALDDLFGRENM